MRSAIMAVGLSWAIAPSLGGEMGGAVVTLVFREGGRADEGDGLENGAPDFCALISAMDKAI
jgi:hypothetical protein